MASSKTSIGTGCIMSLGHLWTLETERLGYHTIDMKAHETKFTYSLTVNITTNVLVNNSQDVYYSAPTMVRDDGLQSG